ncbi:hypothetical protein Agub_g1155 [Astrephomene gubernaculifera]|uniref:Uncharacterized protein n=1 Tax=Astrephomene gubernaculifera TaxID=47775 RepID=A0AAD3DF00_9CHLO|nr:hypothetical protein Agub_g1155 [Astrephomene gubernaculifera]
MMSPSTAFLASPSMPADRDRSAASILLSLSNDEVVQQDVDTSDDQHNSSDFANASRKGQPWTEEEHLAFLQGLRKLGKGNWRQIAKSFVPSRTPTQVASHAQKHFMRVAGITKRKSRFTKLEVSEVVAAGISSQPETSEHVAEDSQQVPEQQPASAAPPAMQVPFPTMPFPFMNPMMFGFPGPFFPPFMCPPPAFAAQLLSAMQKQGPPPMMIPPMFPMAAMATMNPFFMAPHMAAAAQMAATANAGAAAQAATSGGVTTAGTGAAATSDTANSDEVARRSNSTPSSPAMCKPEAHHARPCAPAPAPPASAPTQAGSASDGSGATSAKEPRGGSVNGGFQQPPQQRPSGFPVSGLPLGEGLTGFQASAHSAFRPPQDVKAEC